MFSAGAGVFFSEPEFFLPVPEPEVKNRCLHSTKKVGVTGLDMISAICHLFPKNGLSLPSTMQFVFIYSVMP